MNTSNVPSSKRIRLDNRNRFPISLLIIFAILAVLAETKDWKRRYRPIYYDANSRRAQAAVTELTNRIFNATNYPQFFPQNRQPTRRTRSESDS